MSNRFIYDNENDLKKPEDSIVCKNCKFRDKNYEDGYKRATCGKYDDYKPLDIVFKNQKCNYFIKDN